MSVFTFSPTIYRTHFGVSPLPNSIYHGRRITAQFKETEEAPTPNPKQEEEIEPLLTSAPPKILSPSIDKDIKKVVQKTAGTFAPRASTARKNPAVPGSALYTIFEVQGYLSMVFGGVLAFNLIFPSSEPDIWRLMGMWSIWMFTIPSLRARDCSKEEKEALNYLFLLIPLINVILPFVWRSFAVVWSADTVAFFVMYAWKSFNDADDVKRRFQLCRVLENSIKLFSGLMLFHDSAAISMVCRILVRQLSKEAHGEMGIDLLMDLLLFARAKSSTESPSGVVKEVGQYVDKRSNESSNRSQLSDSLSK